MKIVILDGCTIVQNDLSWEELRQFGDVTIYERTGAGDVISRIGDAEMVLTSKCILSREVLAQCPNVKFIGVLATGYNMVDLAYAKEMGIAVCNVPAYSTDSVAQFTTALLLELCHRAGRHSEAVKSGRWHSSQDFCFVLTPQTELSGKTMGIIGFGNIGRRVAKIAEAMGMKVLISSRYPDAAFATEQIRFASQGEVLSQSDVISLHCPLTEENRGFINRKTIGSMKDGVMILNTSRGPLINETDLAEALKSGKVAGAAVDVLETEPPRDPDHPLIKQEACIITPHIAWIAKEARIRLVDTVTANVKSFLEGGQLNRIL